MPATLGFWAPLAVLPFDETANHLGRYDLTPPPS